MEIESLDYNSPLYNQFGLDQNLVIQSDYYNNWRSIQTLGNELIIEEARGKCVHCVCIT